MALGIRAAATLDDLRRVDEKAEWIGGRIVRLMPTGFRPGLVGGRIYQSLADHCATTGQGVALPDNVGFVVPELRSGRRSFSPDAAYYLGPLPSDDMDFLEGPPTLAVEVRSKSDSGNAAESAMAAKRADYFEAGTLVVWDVDLRAEVIRSYRSGDLEPLVFRKETIADAEPSVPGWRVEVAALLE